MTVLFCGPDKEESGANRERPMLLLGNCVLSAQCRNPFLHGGR